MVRTKKQQVASLSTAESELYAAFKTASECLGIQSVAKDLEIVCGLNLHLDATATMCKVNRRGQGKAKHVDMQNPVHAGGTQAKKTHPEESRYEREPRRVNDETDGETEN